VLAPVLAAPAPAEEEAEAMVEVSREGSSRISDNRSTFRDNSIAFFRLSRMALESLALL